QRHARNYGKAKRDGVYAGARAPAAAYAGFEQRDARSVAARWRIGDRHRRARAARDGIQREERADRLSHPRTVRGRAGIHGVDAARRASRRGGSFHRLDAIRRGADENLRRRRPDPDPQRSQAQAVDAGAVPEGLRVLEPIVDRTQPQRGYPAVQPDFRPAATLTRAAIAAAAAFLSAPDRAACSRSPRRPEPAPGSDCTT